MRKRCNEKYILRFFTPECYAEAKFLNIRNCLEGGRTAESLINDYEVQYGQLNLTHKLRVVRRVNKFVTLLILDVFFCFFIIGKLRHILVSILCILNAHVPNLKDSKMSLCVSIQINSSTK